MSPSEMPDFYLAVGPMCWGRGRSRHDAIEACEDNYRGPGPSECRVYRANTPVLYVDGMGRPTFDAAFEGHEVEFEALEPTTIGRPDSDKWARELDEIYAVLDQMPDKAQIRRDLQENLDEVLPYVAGELEDLEHALLNLPSWDDVREKADE